MLKLSYPRLRKILSLLLTTTVKISALSLANRFNVSKRTIRTDIKRLNADIAPFKVNIKNQREKGYYLAYKKQKQLDILKASFNTNSHQSTLETTDGRIKHLLYRLLTNEEPFTLDEVMLDLFISWNTLMNYINQVRVIIRPYGLHLIRQNNALCITGLEQNKRRCFLKRIDERNYTDYVLGFTANEQRIFNKINLKYLSILINKFLKNIQVDVSDYNRKNIIIHIALTIYRIIGRHYLQKFDEVVMIQPQVETEFRLLFNQLENYYKIKFSQAERKYLIYHVALNIPLIVSNNRSQNDRAIRQNVILFLDRICDNYTFNLRDDQILVENLVNHIKSVVKLSHLSHKRKNPLLDVIVSTFPLAYEMTVTSIDILEQGLSLNLSRDELSFITLHIGASMERLYSTQWRKRSVALICGSGTATAGLLKARLQARFNNYLTIVGTYSYAEYLKNLYGNVDFLISTVPLLNSPVPVIQVDLTNFVTDSHQLYDYITSTFSEQQLFCELFSPEVMFTKYAFDDKKSVLNFLCDQLEKKQIVTNDFRDEVFKREAMYSTAIGGGIAIPHPIKFAAKVSKVAFLNLTHAIWWDKKNQIKYVFLLAIKEEDYIKIQPVFNFLVALQNDSRFGHVVQKCQNSKEVSKVLISFSQHDR
uniref:Putative BglB-family transcriptional antiterminator n=1 Tax=Loigolactobacillus rennini TaxID=238013 RepID=A0A1K2I8C4_9LACO|nr:Putative BglB-family transcriptional antiterminator [Loigolactobacillus rennini]